MSPFLDEGIVWMKGRLVPWKKAAIRIASHVVCKGSSIFEGLRACETVRDNGLMSCDVRSIDKIPALTP